MSVIPRDKLNEIKDIISILPFSPLLTHTQSAPIVTQLPLQVVSDVSLDQCYYIPT